ncbi:MAG: protein kinase domain-containing protein, partial [bacterium]
MAKDIASGLEFIHARGILHLDLKPANIFIGHKNHMLADFGLTPSDSKQICGTPAYMAPEIIRGGHVDFRADLYSLGVIILELLTGENPFLCDSPADTIRKQMDFFPEIPKAGKKFDRFRKLLRALLDKTPSKRPSSAFSVRIELQDILGEDRLPKEEFYLPDGPFIGREDEIEEILRQWSGLEGTQIVSIEGPAGIGKSALCEKAGIEIALTGAKVVTIDKERGAAVKILSPYFQTEYYPILRKHLPGLLFEGGIPEKLIEELEIAPSNPPQDSQEALFRVASAIEELTTQSPIFIVNNTSEMSLLWRELSENRSRAFILWDEGHTQKQIQLTCLNTEEVEKYLKGIFGEIERGEELLKLLTEKTGGNIGDIRSELLAMGLSGAFVPETYNWRFKPEAIVGDDGLETLWQRLEPADKIVATAIAVEGSIDYAILETMFGIRAGASLFSLISKGLINQYAEGDSLSFSPSREFSNAFDNIISAGHARKARLRLARAFSNAEPTPENLYRAGINFVEGDEPEKAYLKLFEAGRAYMKTLRYSNAIKALDLALKYDEYSPDPLTSIKTAKRLALSRKYLGDFEGSREAYYRALAMAEQAGEEDQRASILSDIGVTFFEAGDPEKAIQYYDRALEGHKLNGHGKGTLFDIINKGAALQTMKNYNEARKEYKRAHELAEELDNKLAKCVISLNSGDMDIEEEDFSSALPRILESASIARDEGYGQFLFRSLLDLSVIYRKQGRSKLSGQAVDEAEILAESLGKRSLCAAYLEKAALERIQGHYSNSVTLVCEVMQFHRLLDKEELTKLVVEYAELKANGVNLPPLPLKLRILEENKPALYYLSVIESEEPRQKDIEKLVNKAMEAVYWSQNSLALSMLIYCYKYNIEKEEFEKAEEMLNNADEIIKTSDPYPNSLLNRFKSEYYYLTGNYSASRHSLSLALRGFREIGNRAALAEIEEIRKKLETPETPKQSGLDRLLPIIKALNSTLETGELLSKILTSTIELTGAERGVFLIVDKGGAKPILSVGGDGKVTDINSVTYSHSLVEEVITNKKAEFSENILEDSQLSAVSSIIDMEITMALCVPVKGPNGEVEGLIYADSRIGKGKFDRDMLEILSAMADQAAVALRNAER